MGTLVAWKYPTSLFMNLADHTYVACGNGGARWGCWGGDQGGKAFKQGTGSTKRADAIAGPNGKAGITCYLINGVCHQAANRILLPARITVRGAKGYGVSEALFGTYGRPRGILGLCKAPFDRHSDITGDLSACQGPGDEEDVSQDSHAADDPAHVAYLDRVIALYAKAFDSGEEAFREEEEGSGLEIALFDLMMSFYLKRSDKTLAGIRLSIANQLREAETILSEKGPRIDEFVDRANALIADFQNQVANTLSSEEYQALLGLEPGDIVVLGDIEIARRAYEHLL